ncbi:LPS assembly lipoprotein LptE [uncultured Paracoccus sp.]|uniref:LPS assembly lipoprotein LptE n=1 Tax=uncultured Paracoccus sp. TaxID=189685 RepID=UPI002613D60D|nr:LPS assembly lipoprotein LptE [uncultured Paracoccus sp.]
MSWRDRRTALALLAAAALAGCGFTPVYGPGGGGSALFGQVRAADPQTQDDFAFVRRIQDRLGPEGSRLQLDYALTVAVVPQAISTDQVATRYSLNGTASYRLVDAASGATVTEGQVSNFTSYSSVGTTIATLTGERDARERLATMLADQVVTRLLAAAPAR